MRMLFGLIDLIITVFMWLMVLCFATAIGTLLIFPFMVVFLLALAILCFVIIGPEKADPIRVKTGQVLFGWGIITLFVVLFQIFLPGLYSIALFIGGILAAIWAYSQLRVNDYV